MSKKIVVVFYHDNCLDGWASAYVAWKYYIAQHNVNFRAIPINYGDAEANAIYELRSIDTEEIPVVLFLDFCPTPESMEVVLLTTEARVVVLDHHASQKELMVQYGKEVRFQNRVVAIYANDKSGVGLAWDNFFGHEIMPRMLTHVQDRDLWRFALPDTKEVCEALHAKGMNPWTFEHWDALVVESDLVGLIDLIAQGDTLLAYKEERYTYYMEQRVGIVMRHVDEDGCLIRTWGFAVNAPYEFASELGNRLAQASGTFGIVWSHGGLDSTVVRCSVRSTEEGMDVIPIAKHFGGGGHKHAAGFSVPLVEWASKLTSFQ